MAIIPQKRCTKCGVEKPLTEFSKHPTCKGGFQTQCKLCRRDYMRTPKAKQDKKERRAMNIDKERAASRNWKKNHKAEDREIQRKWRQTPNGKLYSLRHAALRRANMQGDVTAAQLSELFERQNHCAYCKRKFTAKLPATIDHVVPLSKGGLHTISNLVLACKPCNCSKREKEVYLL